MTIATLSAAVPSPGYAYPETARATAAGRRAMGERIGRALTGQLPARSVSR